MHITIPRMLKWLLHLAKSGRWERTSRAAVAGANSRAETENGEVRWLDSSCSPRQLWYRQSRRRLRLRRSRQLFSHSFHIGTTSMEVR